MVEFVKINEDNYEAVLGLEVGEGQRKFVAPNVKSLADAYLYRKAGDVFPYAVQDGDKVVGFVLLDEDEEAKEYMIWRMTVLTYSLQIMLEVKDVMEKLQESLEFEGSGFEVKYNWNYSLNNLINVLSKLEYFMYFKRILKYYGEYCQKLKEILHLRYTEFKE